VYELWNSTAYETLFLFSGKNADFRLFDNPVRMGGKCLLEGQPSERQGNIAKRCSSGSRRRFANLPCFKESFMNKRIVAISVLLLMMCAFAVSVFADDSTKEYEYKVEVSYMNKITKKMATKDYYVWATSFEQAMDLAKKACEWDGLDVRSCGFPVATGKSRDR
jgi:hypothetical protein